FYELGERDAARVGQPPYLLDKWSILSPDDLHQRERGRGLSGPSGKTLDISGAKYPDRILGAVDVDTSALGHDGDVLHVRRVLDNPTGRASTRVLEQRELNIVLRREGPLSCGGTRGEQKNETDDQ